MSTLTRTVRYEHLRPGIRRAFTEYGERITRGHARCLNPDASKGPLRFRIQTPWGEATEAELSLGKERILLRVDEVNVPEGIFSGSTLTIDGPLIQLRVAIKKGRIIVEPVDLAYADLRPILYLVAKQLLPEHLDAEFSYTDSEFTIHFTGGKFEGELRFDAKDVVLEIHLKGLVSLAAPIVASKIDAQLDRWTDEWLTA